jgi:hypothetical protein
MNLEPFGNAVGISDIKDFIECPDRMEDGMRRHITLPDGTRDEPAEHRNWTNAYGSAIHDAISYVENEDLTNGQAVEKTWKDWGPFLDPEDLALLHEDLDKYRGDTPLGMRLIAAEVDVKVPLFVQDGVQYYFRFKLDALYQMIAEPTVFFHRDYKSSKWPKTEKEIHEDWQMSSYNWGIHELYPECARLVQSYEQLRHGNIVTSRNDLQREQIREWLIEHVKALIADTEMKPKMNDFCRYCSKVMECSETERSTRYWRGTLAVLAPMTKVGRKTKLEFAEEGDELERLMTDVLPRAIQVRKHLEHFEKELKAKLEAMPSSERERLGWKMTDRTTKQITAEGLARIHEAVGPVFYNLVSLTKRNVDVWIGKPERGKPLSPQLASIRGEELKVISQSLVVPEKQPDE